MGVEYRANVSRTLEHTGQKTVNTYLGDFNKVTHTRQWYVWTTSVGG